MLTRKLELVELRVESPLRHERVVRSLFDEASLRAGFNSHDRNNDELVCFKSLPTNANPASLLQYFYNAVDNNVPVPSG